MIRTTWTRIHALSEPWHTTGIGQAAALALTIAGFTWAVIGLGVATGAAAQPAAAPHTGIPIPLRVALWWAPVAACILVLLTRRFAGTCCSLLILAPVVRVSSYLWAWWAEIAGGNGHGTGWYAAAVHTPLILTVGLIALLTRMSREEGITR